MTRRLLLLLATMLVALPVHATTLVDAARRGDHHRVRSLLREDPAPVSTTDEQGYTALHWAAIRGEWEIFGQLMAAGAPVDAVGVDGGSPLHWACHHDNVDAVRALLDAGADLTLQNQWGRTPLHVAARRGCLGVAALLLDRGAGPNVGTNEGWTPLHVAYRSGHSRMVELLLARGASPEARDRNGQRPQEVLRERAKPIALDPDALREFTGLYAFEGGGEVKVWLEDDGLRIREFAPDVLDPVGRDLFSCRQEPWTVRFLREDGKIHAVELDFLRRTVRATREETPRYVGSATCRECHLEGGGPFVQWLQSQHAAAYWMLHTDWALFLGRLRPHYRDLSDPASDARCLFCHVTGAQDERAILEAGFRQQEGIGCESCHGPGSLYVDPEIMADREAFLAAGGVVPDERTCREGCHRSGEFGFAAMWAKIAHALPAEGEHP